MDDTERRDSTKQADDQRSEADDRDEQKNAARTQAVEEGQESTADEAPADDVIIIK